MRVQHFVNWQVSFTEHQVHTWRAISSQSLVPSFTIVSSGLSATRKSQGWTEPVFDPLVIYRLSRYCWPFQALRILYKFRKSIHVFCGFWNDWRYIIIYTIAALAGIRICIANEAFGDGSLGYLADSNKTLKTRIKKFLKPTAYRFIATYLNAITWLHPIRIIGFSTRACIQFKNAGFHPQHIIPFGYFVERLDFGANSIPTVELSRSRSVLRLVYVGSLLKTKGLDVAIEAVQLARSNGARITLDIYGPGNPATYLLSAECGTTYCGVIPFGRSQLVIKDYDALVLPSRHDGWGVVTNEAILAGVPVIVSDHAGSACIIRNSGAGTVFKSEDVAELAGIFQDLVLNPLALERYRDAALELATHIEPKNAAAYFIRAVHDNFIADAPAPDSPWS